MPTKPGGSNDARNQAEDGVTSHEWADIVDRLQSAGRLPEGTANRQTGAPGGNRIPDLVLWSIRV